MYALHFVRPASVRSRRIQVFNTNVSPCFTDMRSSKYYGGIFIQRRASKNLIVTIAHREINQDKISLACKRLWALLRRVVLVPPCLLTARHFSELSPSPRRAVSRNFYCFRWRVISRNFHGRARGEYTQQTGSIESVYVRFVCDHRVVWITFFDMNFSSSVPNACLSGTGIHRSQNEHREIILRLIERRLCDNFSVWSLKTLAKI